MQPAENNSSQLKGDSSTLALATGLCIKRRNQLPDSVAPAVGTNGRDLFTFGKTHDERKFFPATFTLILVGRHFGSPVLYYVAFKLIQNVVRAKARN